MTGISSEMRAAWSSVQAAQRYDRKHGTISRDDLPADVRSLAREYKRLQMQVYRRRDGVQPMCTLREDGIIDPIAVEIAAHGSRVIALTKREQVLAVWLMERWGLTQREMERRLNLSDFTVYYLRQSAFRITETEFRELMDHG